MQQLGINCFPSFVFIQNGKEKNRVNIGHNFIHMHYRKMSHTCAAVGGPMHAV